MVDGLKIANLTFFGADTSTELEIPGTFDKAVKCSFTGLYSDVVLDTIDLNKELIKNPNCTRFAIAEGDSMINKGIRHGDLLLLDTSVAYESGETVIAWLSGEQLWSAKTLEIRYTAHGKEHWLLPDHPDYQPMLCTNPYDFILGVLLYSIHPHSSHVRFNRR